MKLNRVLGPDFHIQCPGISTKRVRRKYTRKMEVVPGNAPQLGGERRERFSPMMFTQLSPPDSVAFQSEPPREEIPGSHARQNNGSCLELKSKQGHFYDTYSRRDPTTRHLNIISSTLCLLLIKSKASSPFNVIWIVWVFQHSRLHLYFPDIGQTGSIFPRRVQKQFYV